MPTLYVTIVSHTHWDREWYHPFQEFRLQLVDLIDQVLDILAADPDYHSFLLDGQTIVLEDYLEMRPQREDDLRRYIQSGRLLIGPWHILPDEFLVSPEATVRNLMLGNQVCQRFGAQMPIGYTPDPFGHIGQLPQILAGCGLEAAALQRGLSEEPAELWWEAPDGTRLLLIYLRAGYGNLAWAPLSPTAFIGAVERQIEKLAPHIHTPHLLLMNGTDHMLPQPELPRLIAAANDYFAGEIRLEHQTLPAYLAALRGALGAAPDLPVVHGELRSPQRHPLLPGVLSTRMWIKQRNHACQVTLERYAEPLTALVGELGGKNRRHELWRAWRYLIENHPHDSICGCSIDQVHEEMRTRFDWSEQIARKLAENALRELAAHINGTRLPKPPQASQAAPPTYSAVTAPDDAMLLVYNPLPGAASGRVEVEVPWAGAGRQYQVLDEQARPAAYRWLAARERIAEQRTLTQAELQAFVDQIESGFYAWRLIRDVRFWLEGTQARLEVVLPEYHTGEIGNFDELVKALRHDPAVQAVQQCHLTIYLAGKDKLALLAEDVPGVGYRAYRLNSVSGQASVHAISETSDTEIENEWFHIRANPQDGTLTLTDKVHGAVYVGLNRFEDGGDRGDEYTYCPPEHDLMVGAPAAPPQIRRLDEGALGQSLLISQVYELPAHLTPQREVRSEAKVSVQISSHVQLVAGVRRVGIQTRVDNHAQDHRLRVLFPTDIHSNRAIVDGHFDRLVRTPPPPADTRTWVEQPQPTAPQNAFVAVAEDQRGFLLAAKGLPEYELIETKEGAILALTLLRCVGWLSREDLATRPGHAGPELATPGAQCLGSSTFEYSFIPFGDDLNAAAHAAYAFQAPLQAVSAPLGNGTLPPSQRLLALEPSDLVLSALKPAETGEGFVVRFYNSSPAPVMGQVICALPVREAVLTNLLEQPISKPLPSPTVGVFALEVAPKKIITLHIR